MIRVRGIAFKDEDDAYDYFIQRDIDERDNMKLCIACQHFIENDKKCARAPKPMNPVDGSDGGHFYAESERASWGKCGPEGKFWLAREEKAAA